jgi:diguanylate cyclase (GGDEF)-like protein/PAS domain S-box-containing protein
VGLGRSQLLRPAGSAWRAPVTDTPGRGCLCRDARLYYPGVSDGGRRLDTTAEAAAAVLAAVVENAGLGIALVGSDARPFQANPAFCRMLGRSEDELLAMTFADFTHPDDVDADLALYGEMLAGSRDLYRIQKRYLRKDGSVVWGSLTVSAVRRPSGDIAFAVGLVEDVTERVALQEELRQQALHDHLTGLPNRRLLDDRLTHAVRLAERQSHGLAVVAVDIDAFKTVNDRFGHAAGDEVLRAVARSLTDACRDSDTIARVGGDEFVVLCEGTDSAEHADRLAQRLRALLATSVPLPSGGTVAITASVGASAGAPGDLDGLLAAADRAMYAQKHPAAPRTD